MAVGIGLVFGVLRLVNFAYGQLVMAGAFALAYRVRLGPGRRGRASSSASRVVLALSVAHGPARVPAAADAVAGGDARGDVRGRVPDAERRAARVRALGTIASPFGAAQRPWTIGGVDIRKITIVSVVVAVVCLVALRLLLDRTSLGLHMRAAAMDFRTARLLGVRANRVIGGAVLVSGLLAAVVAVLLTVRTRR